MRSRRGRLVAALVIGLIATAAGGITFATGAFDATENDSVDARFSIRGEHAVPDLAFVAVDAKTFDKLGLQWPFPRSLHGRLIDRLHADGARAIAYDVQFTEPTTTRQDNALIRAVQRAGNVVLSTTEVGENGESNVFGGEKVLKMIGATAGNTIIDTDDSGVWRHFSYQTQGLKSFAVATAEVATGKPVDRSEFDPDGDWIDYAGPPGTVPTYSFSSVLKGEVDPAAFRDKIVVVGASAPSLQDVHPTSAGGGEMAGAEIQANAIATVLDGLPLRSSAAVVSLLLIALLGFLAPLSGLRVPPLGTLVISVGAAGIYLVASQLAFNSGVVVPVVYPLVALLVGAVCTLGLHYLMAAFERQRVRATFARFVPAEVVDQLLSSTDGETRLGGVRRECTMMFTDIRGFTTYAESTSPDEVVKVLNRYLGEMTDAVMDNGGTLVSYMGDGIIAVFGAPLVQPDHADRAIAAAREMLDERLPRFNAWMAEHGHGEGFRIGIGLHSGEVMSGQVGSERRMEYTTIGDTTNTAARLEGMTKESGHAVFISETTRAALQRPLDDLVLVGDRPVRGRSGEIRVWSIDSAR